MFFNHCTTFWNFKFSLHAPVNLKKTCCECRVYLGVLHMLSKDVWDFRSGSLRLLLNYSALNHNTELKLICGSHLWSTVRSKNKKFQNLDNFPFSTRYISEAGSFWKCRHGFNFLRKQKLSRDFTCRFPPKMSKSHPVQSHRIMTNSHMKSGLTPQFYSICSSGGEKYLLQEWLAPPVD